MKKLIQSENSKAFIIVVATVGWLAFLPKAQSVVPPPDGGYPNFTTAEGTNALKNLTTGSANTGVGWYSLFSNATGSFNTATGAGALLFNNGDPNAGEASQNSAFGTAALLFNTTGSSNTAVGTAVLLNNTTGRSNTAVGTGIPAPALFSNDTGSFNVAVGGGALSSNDAGNDNTAIGGGALSDNTAGSSNTAVGENALGNNTSGNGNIALGVDAGISLTGNNNIDIGNTGIAGESDTMRIGDGQTRTFIAGINGATAAGGTAVFINANGQLGTLTSSARFKDEIKPMHKTSETLFSLKPITFRYKKEIDPAGISQFGLVAEEVEKVNPDLVVRDKDGKPYSVRYEQVNAMLLNEFLKEHRKVEEQDRRMHEQEATIAELQSSVAQQQKGMEVLIAQLKEQAAQIQKVSNQVEMSKPAPKVVSSNPQANLDLQQRQEQMKGN
jgi:uncharacterized coiled-coil protein SlyX